MDNDVNYKNSIPKPNHNILNHIIDIAKAAFPYLDSDSQQSVDLILKTGELMNAFQSYKQQDTVTTFSIRKQNIDIEALLSNVRNVCYDQERELVDMVLNFIRAKNMFDTYSAFASTMAFQSENTENTDGTSDGMGSPDMMDILGSLLTPEQKSTFDNINMMFSVMQ